jgi:hypothetical protein
VPQIQGVALSGSCHRLLRRLILGLGAAGIGREWATLRWLVPASGDCSSYADGPIGRRTTRTRCPTHRVPLVDCCPTCKRRFPHWGQRSWDPNCCSCGQPLFWEIGRQSSDAPGCDWELRTASLVAELLEWGARLIAPFSLDHFLFPNIAAVAAAVGGPTALPGFGGVARPAPVRLSRLSLFLNPCAFLWLSMFRLRCG